MMNFNVDAKPGNLQGSFFVIEKEHFRGRVAKKKKKKGEISGSPCESYGLRRFMVERGHWLKPGSRMITELPARPVTAVKDPQDPADTGINSA